MNMINVDRVISLHLISVSAMLNEGASTMREHSQYVSLERNFSCFMAQSHASRHAVQSRWQAWMHEA
jgi:hypothetical protein